LAATATRRSPSWRIDSVAEVELVLRRLQTPPSGPPTTIIFDVENTIVAPNPEGADLAAAMKTAIAAVACANPGASVLFVSNGSLQAAGDDDSIRRALSENHRDFVLIRQARKPRTQLDIDWSHTVVVGDQLLTDGLLAVRHGATFVELCLGHRESKPSRVNRRLGELTVRHLLFRRASQERLP
jgi:predicted HAD superfamily phosphohydrolase YqeG